MSKRNVDIYSCDNNHCGYQEEVQSFEEPSMDFREITIRTESTDGDYPSDSKSMLCLPCVKGIFPGKFSNKPPGEAENE